MKKTLLDLIDESEKVRNYFLPAMGSNIIYNVAEFSKWKQALLFEIQEIHDKTHDKFIWGVLILLKQGFNGWKDESSFNELVGSLETIKNNISKYYPDDYIYEERNTKGTIPVMKKPKLFISHSSQDKWFVAALVDLFDSIGLAETDIFCSSITGYGIPLGEDIFDYLKKQFNENDLHVFFVLSENYYASIPCLNEMGAAWILQNKYTTILLPGFEFNEIQGAVNPRQIGLKLDSNEEDLKLKLGQLKDILIEEFKLRNISDVRWESKRKTFLDKLKNNIEIGQEIQTYTFDIISSKNTEQARNNLAKILTKFSMQSYTQEYQIQLLEKIKERINKAEVPGKGIIMNLIDEVIENFA